MWVDLCQTLFIDRIEEVFEFIFYILFQHGPSYMLSEGWESQLVLRIDGDKSSEFTVHGFWHLNLEYTEHVRQSLH